MSFFSIRARLESKFDQELRYEGCRFSFYPSSDKGKFLPAWGMKFNSDKVDLDRDIVIWVTLFGDNVYPEHMKALENGLGITE